MYRRISKVIMDLNLPVPRSIPGHSILEWVHASTCTQSDDKSNDIRAVAKKRYKLSNISDTYMNNAEIMQKLNDTIRRMETEISLKADISSVYDEFLTFVQSEMDKHIESVTLKDRKSQAKSLYKPYWNEELQIQWDVVKLCESDWLRYKGDPNHRRRLKERFCAERRTFDRLNRRHKQNHQVAKQRELHDMCLESGANSRKFLASYRQIGNPQ